MDQYYSKDKYEKTPPVFVIGFSLGCMHILNILLKQSQNIQNPNYNKVNYDSVSLYNPFFGLPEFQKIKKVYKPIMKIALRINKYANLPEYKYKNEELENHHYNWVFDEENQF